MKNLYKPIKLERHLHKGVLAASVIGAAFISGNLQSQTYCSSSPISGYSTDIWNVTLGSLNSTSSCSSTAGPGSTTGWPNSQEGCMYSNYTSPTIATTSLVTGVNYPLSVTVGDCSGYSESGYVSVWIDFNQNGSFTDPGEQVYDSPNTNWNPTGTVMSALTGITIPSTATAGNTRMRVVACEYANPSPCWSGNYNFYYGETEDYSIDIIAAQPCNFTPSLSAVVAPSTSLCPGASVFLYQSPSDLNSGVTYSWQASTTSSVGPYTAISNATNAVLSTSFSTTTWIRLVSECAYGGSTISATPSQVLVSAVTVSTVPYFEGFEEPQIQNDQGPNCSWNISNPTYCNYGNSAYYGNYTPYDGNGMAYFGSNQYPNGNTAFYFWSNGIQLNAGVTYSASIFYDGYGYNPFGLYYGTSQSSTGLTSIAQVANVSTNGYKNLSDTFQVSASGIYYIAISGSTPYGYEYVALDDLSITAPCNYVNNAATTTLTAPAAACLGKSVVLTASGANSYTWSTGSTANSITVTPMNGTSYTVTGTKNISNCTLAQSAFINVDPTPILQILPSVSSICSGQTATLIALGSPLSYTWSDGDYGATQVTTTVSPTSSTTYSLIGINSYGCLGYATQLINVNQTPAVSVAGNLNICMGEPGTLLASGANVYTWSSPSSFLQTNPIAPYPTVSTSYTVTGIDANGCSGSTTVDLTVNICTGIKTNSGNIANLQVYPNPNNGVFTVELSNGLTKNIEVMDVTGRVVLTNASESDQVTVNINNLSNGIYYVKVKSDNAVEVLKVVKQ